jgi:hypothetical protein
VYVQLCSAPQRFADVEACLRLSDTAADKARTRNAIATLCREQTCVEAPAAAPPAEPKVEAPKVETPQVPPQADPKVIIPPPVPAGTCTPTKARNLKIRGSGKQCDDAKKLREQIKHLREKVNCILSAFEGKIPEVVTVIKAAPVLENIPKHNPAVLTEEKKEARVFVEKVVANYAAPAAKGKSIHIVPAPVGYKAEVKAAEVKAAYNAPVKALSKGKSVKAGSIKKARSVAKVATYGAAKAVSRAKKAESRGRSRKAKSVKKYKAGSNKKARKGRSNRRRNGRERARSQRKQRRARSARKNKGYKKTRKTKGGSRRARSRRGNNGRRVRQPAPRPAAKAY